MHYVRGNRHDYDRWEKELKNEGWAYEKHALPYFKKSENMQISRLQNSPYHNVGGPMTVIEGVNTTLGDAYLAAVRKLGYEVADDPNGAKQEGAKFCSECRVL